jgi:hypothetical protein
VGLRAARYKVWSYPQSCDGTSSASPPSVILFLRGRRARWRAGPTGRRLRRAVPRICPCCSSSKPYVFVTRSCSPRKPPLSCLTR